MRRTMILIVTLLLVAVVPLAQDTEDKAVEEIRQLFERQLITVGSWGGGHVEAWPVLCVPPRFGQVAVRDSLRRNMEVEPFVLIDWAETTEDVADKPGDSVTLLWSGGVYETTIDTLDFRRGGCGDKGIFCRLEYTPPPIARGLQFGYGPFLILRRPLQYSGSLIPFTTYEPQDSSIQVIRDSLFALIREDMLDRRDKPPFGVKIAFFGTVSDTTPDTLFAVGNGWWQPFQGVSSLSILTKTDDMWNHRLLKDPTEHRRISYIFYACDLNGDGVLEVLVKGEFSDDIYLFRDGELIYVTQQLWDPC